MRVRTSQILETNFLIGHRFDYLWASDEHVRSLVHHYYKVGYCRRIYCTTCTRAHNYRNLRNHTTGSNISEENLRIRAKTRNAFLNPSSSTIIQANYRRAGFESHIEYFTNLQPMHFAKRSTINSKILSKAVNGPSIYGSMPAYNPVPRNHVSIHIKVPAPMFYQWVDFHE